MISPDEKAVLRDFALIVNSINVPFVLVGAGARLMVFDWEYELQSTRTTKDWDVGIQITDWEAFGKVQNELTSGSDALFRQTKLAHRFRHKGGIALDVIPFGGIEDEDGAIVWPQDERQMVVLGFREVLSNAIAFDVGEGISVPVATAPGIAVLKVFAYRDREKVDDILDLYFLMENYDRAGNEDRIFDELLDLLSEGLLEYEFAGTYLLGVDVGRLINQATYVSLLEITTRFLDPYSPDLAPLVRRSVHERQEEAERARIVQMFSTFREGVHSVKQ
jgi:predicted nucleotidyltransferase